MIPEDRDCLKTSKEKRGEMEINLGLSKAQFLLGIRGRRGSGRWRESLTTKGLPAPGSCGDLLF